MPILKEMPTFPFIDLFNVVVVPLDLAPDLAPLPVHRTFPMIDPTSDIGIAFLHSLYFRSSVPLENTSYLLPSLLVPLFFFLIPLFLSFVHRRVTTAQEGAVKSAFRCSGDDFIASVNLN